MAVGAEGKLHWHSCAALVIAEWPRIGRGSHLSILDGAAPVSLGGVI